METHDEFKKNLIACMDEAIEVAETGDAHDLLDFAHHAHARMSETLTYIQQLEAEKGKPGKKLICEITVDGEEILRKALDKTEVDGKTLAEWIELAKGYKQLEAELATAKQELDAAISALHGDCGRCMFQQTVKCDSCRYGVNPFYEHDCWEWEGISPDTEVQPNE